MEKTERLLQLQTAANYLNRLEEPSEVVGTLKTMLPLAKAGARLTGETAVLNPLLDSYAESPIEFRSVIRMVIQARVMRECSTREYKSLLLGETEEEHKAWREVSINIKNETTRRYVKNTRDRLRKALKKHNAKLAGKDQLRGTARLAWEQKKWQEWSERKEAYVREGTEGRMSRAEIAMKTAEFWELIDDELSDE